MKSICSIIVSVLAIFVGIIGDIVYSYDTITGEVTQKEVTAVFVRESDHINYLTILDEQGREQVIETTDSHPFWVVTEEPDLERAARSIVDENGVWLYHENVGPTEHGFWVEAKDLKVGDVFIGANGELTTLTNIVRVEQSGGINVFNFTVAGNHNYFILAKEYEYGQTCILVHNADCHGHHSLPMFLGGNKNQHLTNLNSTVHSEYHKDLYKTLRKRGLPEANWGTENWKNYMMANPRSQIKAFAAALESAKKIDTKYGTNIAQDLLQNFRKGLFTKYR